MIFARLSVHRSDFLLVLNWKLITRSCSGIITRNSAKPARADGPSCRNSAARMTNSA